MKKILFFATVITAMVSCTDESFVGENTAPTSQDYGAIAFTTSSSAITRAPIDGAAAAALLNRNFVVEGIKTVSSTKSEVFDNYNVNYFENTADKTASNTANWEYVNQPILTGKTAVSEQTIKYWDFAASQYDFWAYSVGNGNATVSTLDHDADFTTGAYTITADVENLAKVYISDLVTAYNPTVTGKPEFGQEVNLSFRSLVSKVRVGLYENIPGYSVKEVKFYTSSSASLATDGTEENATLFASSAALPSVPTSGTATYTVTFPITGQSNVSNSDYNKAHVTFDPSGTKVASLTFGELTYGGKHRYETDDDIWLRITSAAPTWAVESGASAGDYSIVIPNETGEVLTLKVDYTLESTDGSGETITVHGATALVPAQYTRWKPNYAYTYLFKISDNTNGLTNPSITNKVGLYPITLDAVVEGSTDGTQETITTVATPSITTYSVTSDVTTNNEYKTTDDIYVTATIDGTLINMSGKATLYTVTKNSANYVATEAEVLAALNKYSTITGASAPYTYTGRNEILLTPVNSGLSLTATSIPLVDGNSITGLTAGQVALIDKSKLSAGTYAFVYETTTGTPTTVDKYEAIATTSLTDVNGYYTYDGSTYTQITTTTTPDGSTTYYDKYTETNNTYAIKVIKVVAP